MGDAAWRATAATTSGRAWPTLVTPIPLVKSRNVLPSTSVTVAPSARAMNIGWVVATPAVTALRRRSASARLCGPGMGPLTRM